jgi:GntR family transcriptional regulator/MocR family aminotransferase
MPTPLAGVSAGLHALLPVGSPELEGRLVRTAEYAGLRLHGLHTSGYWHTPEDGPAALVIGYGTPAPHTWRRALDLLTEVIAAES